jgi:hypothetical protein
MAFPTTPADYHAHKEGDAEFYSHHGRWYRKRLPHYGVMGGPSSPANCVAIDHHDFNLSLDLLEMDRPRYMIVVRAAYAVRVACGVRFAIAANGWVDSGAYRDASGMVRWGNGGAAINNWRTLEPWPTNSFWVHSHDSTRLAQVNRPQFLELRIMRNGPNATVITWVHHSQVVTANALVRSYVKMDCTVGIDRMRGFNLGLSNDAAFAVGRMSAEVY